MKNLDLSRVVEQFKRNWPSTLKGPVIEEICQIHGVKWRKRVLDPVRTVQLFLIQVLHGNTACTHLRHLSGLRFSASAYCQARMRLPLAVFDTLLERIGTGINKEECGESKWYGHRTFLADGSSFSMPDTASLANHFGYPTNQKQGCGFPVAHMLALVHAGTGMILRVLSAPTYTHDASRVAEIHPELRADDLLVLDRGFCSFGHICLLLEQKLHCVIRVHSRQLVSFRTRRSHTTVQRAAKGVPRSKWLKKLGDKDQLVEWFKPKNRNSWMSIEQFSALAPSIVVRELRYHIRQKGFRTKEVTLVTTLLSAEQYPAQAIAELYGLRWSIETNFRHLKITMGMDVLRCETVDGVLKELCMFCVIYNLIRLVMLKAATRQHVPLNRISFIDALRWLLSSFHQPAHLQLVINPLRPNRRQPRARKRGPKQYPRLTIPRQLKRSALIFQ